MGQEARRILVLYRTLEYPIRTTISDHLFSFRRYSNANCLYVNVAAQPVPRSLGRHPFDLIVFHTTLLSSRVRRERFRRLMRRLEFLSENEAVRIALPQDEHIYTTILCEFIDRLAVDHVFSPAPEETWRQIYGSVERSDVSLHQVLTGYLEPSTLARIERLAELGNERTIDVGYRAHGLRYGLGRHGYMKIAIARAFQEAMGTASLRTDISTRFEDTFLADSWYRFLLRCRFVLGIEGGASVHDPIGEIGRKVRAYVTAHPGATFEDVEAACFPGIDGSFPLYALSPRHLEAAATRTGQLLVEGAYNGVLEPGVHYVPIARDLSNLDDAVAAARNEAARVEMVQRAYDDVVRSGLYTYERFVDTVLEQALSKRTTTAARAGRTLHVGVRTTGWLGWLIPLGIGLGARTLHVLARHAPGPVSRWLRRIEKRVRGK